MIRTRSTSLAAATIALALSTVAAAQSCPFRVKAAAGYLGSPPPINVAPERASQLLAQAADGYTGNPAANCYAEVRPQHMLAYGYGAYSAAVTHAGATLCTWSFDDIRFDSATAQSVQAQLRLLSSGSVAGPSGGAFDLNIELWHDTPTSSTNVYWWPQNGFTPGGLIQPPPMNVTTNTRYRLEIEMHTAGYGNQGWGEILSILTFDAQPFVLPGGVTCNSALASIANNTFAPGPVPDLPRLDILDRFIENQTANVRFRQQAISVLPPVMVAGFGGLPACNTMFGQNLGLWVLNPVVTITIPLDPAGYSGVVSIPIPSGLAGLPIAMQAFRFDGVASVDDIHGSNPLGVVVQ